jgi:hypothetical protein
VFGFVVRPATGEIGEIRPPLKRSRRRPPFPAHPDPAQAMDDLEFALRCSIQLAEQARDTGKSHSAPGAGARNWHLHISTCPGPDYLTFVYGTIHLRVSSNPFVWTP